MKTTTILILFLSLFSHTAKAQKPQWINFQERKLTYNENYLVGFISEKQNSYESDSETQERIKALARKQLAESIQLSIKSVTNLETVVENQEVYNLINQSSISLSEIQISDLREDFYFDKKQKTYYAIAFAEKKSVIENYENKLKLKFNEIENNFTKAKQYSKYSDKKNALKTYFSNLVIFSQAEKDISILVALKSDYENLANQLFSLKSSNELAIHQLTKSETNNLNDVAFFMAFSLNLQLENKTKPIDVENFTLSTTSSASELSRLYKKLLIGKLNNNGFNINLSKKQKAPYKLTGNYWENGEFINIASLVSDTENNKIIASAEGKILKSYLEDNNIQYEAPNIKNIINIQDSINQNRNVLGNLSIEFTTNRGNNNLVYEEGDTLQLFIKSNRECYFQFIYHFADGSKILLLDNYKIEREQINQMIKIDQEFECYPPFGTELLQLNAQTTPFKALNTKYINGFVFIENDINQILVQTRGFKPINNEDGMAQKSIIITTMPKE